MYKVLKRRAELLLCLLDLLFFHVLVAVVVLVCLRSLLKMKLPQCNVMGVRTQPGRVLNEVGFT